MIRLTILLFCSLSSHLWGNEFESLLSRMRESSGISYYENLQEPFSKVLSVEDGVLKQGINFNRIGISNTHDQLPSNEKNLDEGKKIGELLLQKLIDTEALAEGEKEHLPFQVLVPPHKVEGEITFSPKDLRKSKSLYMENPSSYLALVYLELALIYQEKTSLEKMENLLSIATDRLNLENLKFENDPELRSTLPPEYNFGRPESVLLYLRAQIAFQKSNHHEATRIANILIKNNPSDPYAWQALFDFGASEGFQLDLIEKLIDIYPVVFGCKQVGLNVLNKEEFAELIHKWSKLPSPKSTTKVRDNSRKTFGEINKSDYSGNYGSPENEKTIDDSIGVKNRLYWPIIGVLLIMVFYLLFVFKKGSRK